jgi:hypothetical protein
MADNETAKATNATNEPNAPSAPSAPSSAPMQQDIFCGVTPEEIVLIASIFAIALASDLSDDNATSLAFFFSTIGSNIGLFVDRRARERTPRIPGVG